MELISAMRRSHSRDSSKSNRSNRLERTDPSSDHPPQDPFIHNVPNDYDDSHSGSDIYDYPENYDKTRNDCLGKIILDLAHDNLLLAKKCNLNGMNSNIHEICDNFDNFVRLGEQKRKDHSLITQKEMEDRLVQKKLSSHLINQAFQPPKIFSEYPVLTSINKAADIVKLFPSRIKFSGNPRDSLSLLEFITSLNTAQEQARLSEKEFKQMLVSCTTGAAHQFLIDWLQDNDEEISNIYHQLALRFDSRKSPEQAKAELFGYKASRDKTLAQVESHIMSLANRASAIFPPGPMRKFAKDLEACDALIRCLPPTSAALVRRVHGDLCTEMGQPCTSTDLSRALHNLRHTIDADIKTHGGGDMRLKGRFPIKNKKVNSYSSYGIYTTPVSTGFPAKTMDRSHTQASKETRLANGPHITPQRRNSQNLLRPRNANRQWVGKKNDTRHTGVSRRHIKITGCSLCGLQNHKTTDCKNMRNDSGTIVRVHPVQGTCGQCPGNRKNTLHHPPALCPYRPTYGCLNKH